MDERLQELSGARVLVTGASGFIGATLVERLRRDGAEIHAVSRRERASTPGGARWWSADTAELPAVRRLFGEIRPDFVFDLASHVTGRRDVELVPDTLRANLVGTVNVLVAATEGGARRVVLAGSMEEPDVTAGEAPSSPYAAAKGAASLYARFFRALYSTPVVTARIFMAYGPAQPDRTKVVPYAIGEALAGRAPKLSSGSRPVDWIHVDDVARGLVALATAPGIEGETLDLGSGELVTVREVVERICRATGAPPPEIGALPDRPLERARRADVERTAARTGFRPAIALDEGLAATIAWHRG